MSENGETKVAPAIQLAINWYPSSGRLEVMFPQTDDVVKLGMLEMAKQVLADMRAKAQTTGPSLIIPARMPH